MKRVYRIITIILMLINLYLLLAVLWPVIKTNMFAKSGLYLYPEKKQMLKYPLRN